MAAIYAEFKGCSPLLIHITSGRLNLCIELFSEVCFWPIAATFKRLSPPKKSKTPFETLRATKRRGAPRRQA